MNPDNPSPASKLKRLLGENAAPAKNEIDAPPLNVDSQSFHVESSTTATNEELVIPDLSDTKSWTNIETWASIGSPKAQKLLEMKRKLIAEQDISKASPEEETGTHQGVTEISTVAQDQLAQKRGVKKRINRRYT